MKQVLLVLGAVLSTSAFSAYRYDCYPPKYGSFQDKMVLQVLSGTKVKLDGHVLELDPKYRPRLNKEYRRFDGDTSFLTSESYAIDVLVHEKALDGENKASMKIMARGEGFFNDYFSCFLR